VSTSIRVWDKTGATLQPSKSWPVAEAGETVAGEKQFAENSGSATLTLVVGTITQVSTNDGYTMLVIGLDSGTVVPPYGVSATLGAAGDGGVWGSLTTYYYVITATNATGETQVSTEVSVTVDVATKRVTLAWTAPTGATGYKIYRSTTTASYTGSSLRTTIGSGATVTYIDDGSAAGAGSAPSANTTAGAAPDYGTAPSLGSSPISLGTLAPGQMAAYWVGWVLPVTADDDGNPRQAKIVFSQS
jgi:hypothetical protein